MRSIPGFGKTSKVPGISGAKKLKKFSLKSLIGSSKGTKTTTLKGSPF